MYQCGGADNTALPPGVVDARVVEPSVGVELVGRMVVVVLV